MSEAENENDNISYDAEFYESNMKHLFESLKPCNKNEFIKNYRQDFNKGILWHNTILRLITMNIMKTSDGNLDDVKSLSRMYEYIVSIESEINIQSYKKAKDYPLKNTNLIILCCKFNNVNVLNLLLNKKKNNLLSILYNNTLFINDVDDNQFNAIYYAMKSNQIEIFNVILERLPNKYDHPEAQNNLLISAYQKLSLYKIHLEDNMKFSIFNELMNLNMYEIKLYNDNDDDGHDTTIHNITDRINFIMKTIIPELVNQFSKALHPMYIEAICYKLKFIAHNIYIIINGINNLTNGKLKKIQKLHKNFLELPLNEIAFLLMLEYGLIMLRDNHVCLEFKNILRSVFKEEKYFQCILLLYSSKNDTVPGSKNLNKFYDEYYEIRDMYWIQQMRTHITLCTTKIRENDRLIYERTIQLLMANFIEKKMNYRINVPISHHLNILISMLLPDLKNLNNNIIILEDVTLNAPLAAKNTSTRTNTSATYDVNIKSGLILLGNVLTEIIYFKYLQTIENIVEQLNCVDTISDIISILSKFEYWSNEQIPFFDSPHKQIKHLAVSLSECFDLKTEYDFMSIEKINDEIETCNERFSKFGKDLDKIKNDLLTAVKVVRQHTLIFGNLPEYIKETFAIYKRNVSVKTYNERCLYLLLLIEKLIEESSSRWNINSLRHYETQIFKLKYCISQPSIGLGPMKIPDVYDKNILKISNFYEIKTINSQNAYQYKQMLFNYATNLQLLIKRFALDDVMKNKHRITLYLTTCTLSASVKMYVYKIITILKILNRIPNNYSSIYSLDYGCLMLFGTELENYFNFNSIMYHTDDVEIMILIFAIRLSEQCGNKKAYQNSIPKNITKISNLPDDLYYKTQYNWVLQILSIKQDLALETGKGTISKVKELQTLSGDLHMRDYSGFNLLTFASNSWKIESSINFLFENKVKVDDNNARKLNVIHTSASSSISVELFREILFKNLNLYDNEDDNHQIPLQRAIRKHKFSKAKILLEQYKNPTKNRFEHFMDILFYLSKLKFPDINTINNIMDQIWVLQDKILELEPLPIDKYFISSIATAHLYIFNKLLLFDIIDKKIGDLKCTPLHWTIIHDNYQFAKILLEHRVDVNSVCNNLTPLQRVMQRPYSIHDEDFTRLLLDKNANVNAISEGYISLHYAAIAGKLNIIKILIEYNVNVDAKNGDGVTPLHFAVQHNHLPIVEYLISINCDKYCLTKNMFSVFHFAASINNPEMMDFLLKHCDLRLLSVVNKFNSMPLSIAITAQHFEITKLFFQYNDIDIQKHSNEIYEYVLYPLALTSDVRLTKFILKVCQDVTFDVEIIADIVFQALFNGNIEIAELLLPKTNTIELKNIIYSIHKVKSQSMQLNVLEFVLKNKLFTFNILDKLRSNFCNPLSVYFLSSAASAKINVKVLQKFLKLGFLLTDIISDSSTILRTAIRNNWPEVIELLVKENYQINENHDGEQTICYAISRGYMDIIEKIIDVPSFDANLGNPLEMAIKYRMFKIVVKLIEKGARINVIINPQILKTSLHSAAELNDAAIFNYLLSQEIPDSNAITINDYCLRNGKTLLHIAAAAKNSKNLKLLFNYHNIDPNIKCLNGKTALHEAIDNNHFEGVQIILDHPKLVINETSIKLSTPLHMAAKIGNLHIIKLLLDKGVNVNARDIMQYTALDIAIYEGHVDVVEYFLKTFNDALLHKGNLNNTQLHYAVMLPFNNNNDNHQENQIKILRQLLKLSKYDINETNQMYKTPLHYASINNSCQVMEFLINNGAIYNAFDMQNNTPIKLATDKTILKRLSLTDALFKCFDLECAHPENEYQRINHISQHIENLIEDGAFVNAVNVMKLTPLLVAVKNAASRDAIKTLLIMNGNPNVTDEHHWMPIHYACKNELLKVVKLLLVYGSIYNANAKGDDTAPTNLCEDLLITILLNVTDSLFEIVGQRDELPCVGQRDEFAEILNADCIEYIINAKHNNGNTLIGEAYKNNFSEISMILNICQDMKENEAVISECLANNFQISLLNLKKLESILNKRNIIFNDNIVATVVIELMIANHKFQEKTLTHQEILKLNKRCIEFFGSSHPYTLLTYALLAVYTLFMLGKGIDCLNILNDIQPEMVTGSGDMKPIILQIYFLKITALSHMQYFAEGYGIVSKICQTVLPAYGSPARKLYIQYDLKYGEFLFDLNRLDESLSIFQKLKDIDVYNLATILQIDVHIAVLLFRTYKISESSKLFQLILPLMKQFKIDRNFLSVVYLTFIVEHINDFNINTNVQNYNKQKFRHMLNTITDMLSVLRKLFMNLTDNNDIFIESEVVNCVLLDLLTNNKDYLSKLILVDCSILSMSIKHLNLYFLNSFLPYIKTTHPHEFEKILNSAHYNNNTLLHDAALMNAYSILILLLKFGIKYNCKNKQNLLPYELAIDSKIVGLLKLIDKCFTMAESGDEKLIYNIIYEKGYNSLHKKLIMFVRNKEKYTLVQVLLANKHKKLAQSYIELIK